MNEIKEPPVYTVRGANWEVNIPTCPYNQQFSTGVQMTEIASKALEVFKGIRKDYILKLDDGNETPHVGPTLLVYLEGSKKGQENPFLVLTHVCFADVGCYSDSVEMEFVFNKLHEGNPEQLKKELKNFDALRKEIIKKKRKKKGS